MINNEKIIEIIGNSFSIKEASVKYFNYYNNYTIKKINNVIIENNLDILHFDKNKNKRKYDIIKKECPNCHKEFETKKGDKKEKTCCSRECANVFLKRNHSDETKEKIKKTINEFIIKSGKTKIIKECIICNDKFEMINSKKEQKCCSQKCASTSNWLIPSYRERISMLSKERCSTTEGKNRMRDIGKFGGFGKKGYTNGGIYYQSTLEKNCIEYLECLDIKFECHKGLPNCSKISDVYLIEYDIWIELDGIDREKRKKYLKENYQHWLDKLEIYKNLNLNLIILKKFEDFKKYIINLQNIK